MISLCLLNQNWDLSFSCNDFAFSSNGAPSVLGEVILSDEKVVMCVWIKLHQLKKEVLFLPFCASLPSLNIRRQFPDDDCESFAISFLGVYAFKKVTYSMLLIITLLFQKRCPTSSTTTKSHGGRSGSDKRSESEGNLGNGDSDLNSMAWKYFSRCQVFHLNPKRLQVREHAKRNTNLNFTTLWQIDEEETQINTDRLILVIQN